MYLTLVISIIGAVPTYLNWYIAHETGVPSKYVNMAHEQEELWLKNFTCVKEQNFQEFTTSQDVTVGSIICSSGDISLEIKTPDSPKRYRWVGAKTSEEKTHASVGLLIQEVIAAEQRNV